MSIQKSRTSSEFSRPPLQETQKAFLAGKLQIPYIVDNTMYRPFSERMHIFSRVMYDETFKAFGRPIQERVPIIITKKKPGYSQVDFAARSAAWTVYDSFQGAFSWNKLGEPSRVEGRVELPKYEVTDHQQLTAQVKNIAMFYGASLVGIAKLDRRWVYTHTRQGERIDIPPSIEYAIVLAIEMDALGIASSPTIPAAIATGNGYSRMAFTIACLAEFIRNLGYQAIPCGNDTAMSVPLAVDAGLGQFSRMGLLITPDFGPRVRLAKVLTDLPLNTDKPDVKFNQGVIRFCNICKKCVKHCPSKSISDMEPTWMGTSRSNNPGVLKWYVNPESCYTFWVNNGGDCSNCIRVCPFTKSRHWSHNVVRWFIKHIPKLNRFWLWADRIFGYGKKRNPDEFWMHNKYIHTR
ncbi:MAG: reductive dehalogenase [Candidatus Heimdallarchaeota archaeon]